MRCAVPGCPRRGRLVALPLSGDRAWRCQTHGGAARIARMRLLIRGDATSSLTPLLPSVRDAREVASP
jgi:hypothetical protein